MDKEFNPTHKDLLLVESLILDIRAKKNGFVTRKVQLENSLSQLGMKYKDVRQGSKDFHRIKETRSNIKNHLGGLELNIKSCNDELTFKTKLKLEIEHHLRHHPTPAIEETK